jgi:hypothetical protein
MVLPSCAGRIDQGLPSVFPRGGERIFGLIRFSQLNSLLAWNGGANFFAVGGFRGVLSQNGNQTLSNPSEEFAKVLA